MISQPWDAAVASDDRPSECGISLHKSGSEAFFMARLQHERFLVLTENDLSVECGTTAKSCWGEDSDL